MTKKTSIFSFKRTKETVKNIVDKKRNKSLKKVALKKGDNTLTYTHTHTHTHIHTHTHKHTHTHTHAHTTSAGVWPYN